MNHSLQSQAHAIAVENGFWDYRGKNDGLRKDIYLEICQKLLLIHAEISEATEALRNGNPPDKHLPEFNSCQVELADAVIRIMDIFGRFGWDLEETLIKKIAYNSGREYKHGKAF